MKVRRHVVTINLVFEIPCEDEEKHDACVEMLEATVNDSLDDGWLQDGIHDCASDRDGWDEEIESVAASCTVQEMEGGPFDREEEEEDES